MEKVKVTFEVEKETKNTIRFAEKVAKGKPAYIGTVYVQKHTLAQVGWSEDKTLVLEVSVE